MNRALATCVPVLLGLGGVLWSHSEHPPAPTSRTDSSEKCQLSIVLRSDSLDYLVESEVTIAQGCHSTLLRTDDHGQTRSLHVAPGQAIAMELEEALADEDHGLGQSRIIALDKQLAAARDLTIHCLQPTLRSYTLTPGDEIYAEPIHDRWVITGPPTPDEYEMDFRVAMLPTQDTVDSYLAYHGIEVTGMSAGIGVVLRSSSVRLPACGLWLTVDCQGTEFEGESPPDIRSMLICRSAEDAGPTSLDLSLKGFDGRWAQIFISGSFGTGDNVILCGSFGKEPLDRLFVSGSSRNKSDERSVPEMCCCVPEAPNPPVGWRPESYVSAKDVKEYVGASATEVVTEMDPSTTRVGGVECPARHGGWKGDVAMVYQGTSAVLIRAKDGEGTDSRGHLSLMTPIDEIGYEGGAISTCKAAFIHEALTRTTWSVPRKRTLIPNSDKRPETVYRKIQSCSLEWFGPSLNRCDCP